ncbi:hypothetical protein BBJ28_00009961 [Nothophytophthora sp. Chile5]|nr:hypothetical protein BBJ28_00009961 [Nothophytophthora sp. Chile5]
MAGKAKASTAGRGDDKAVVAAATAAFVAEEDHPSEEDEGQVKTGSFSFSDGAKYSKFAPIAFTFQLPLPLHSRDLHIRAVTFSIEGEFCSVGGRVVRQGHGAFVTGAESYEGGWDQDQMHGHGVYSFATGAKYDGDFQQSRFHGAGSYRWPDGAHYEGDWHCNRMHGSGNYVDKDGVEWRGRFVNGKYDNGRIFHTLR